VVLGYTSPFLISPCAKLFHPRTKTRSLWERPFLSRWIFDVEVIARYVQAMGSPEAAMRGIYEYPLQRWTDIGGSKLKSSDFLAAFRDLIRIRRRYQSLTAVEKGLRERRRPCRTAKSSTSDRSLRTSRALKLLKQHLLS
jgi:hypothetical protein